MSAPSSNQARTQMVALLKDTLIVATDLQDELVTERQALKQQDIGAIDAVIDRKGHCIEKLASLDRARDELCEKFDFAAGPNRMQDLIAWCDHDEMIARAWQRLLSVTTESRTLNITNGAIIRARQQHIEGSLAVLRGTSPGAETYSPTGGESSGFGRRPIAQA